MKKNKVKDQKITGITKQLTNFNNFMMSTQKSDIATTYRSSFGSTMSRKVSRMASRMSNRLSSLNADILVREQAWSPPPISSNLLQVPYNPILGNSLSTRMDFILRKRTRLLERQKTKNIQVEDTFGQEEEDKFP